MIKRKNIKIGDYYKLCKKYGDLNISVSTPYGYKKILACDITAKNSKYITIITENNKKLICSPQHKIKTINNKFINARDVIINSTKILTIDGYEMVKTIKFYNNHKDLLDIQVAEVEQYYSNGIVSHNSTILKILTYILFNKTLETEKQVKYGNYRFVNNRNGADFCNGYMVIAGNGEYYGIKRETKIEYNREGKIKGVPTTLNYYLLSDANDELTDGNLMENLNEDQRRITQKKIEKIIGTYNNFMRIVMTTSDTLNKILSNDMAEFIDSLLFDSGLDVFDKKLTGWKKINKRINEQSRVLCNVELKTTENTALTQEIRTIESEINQIESIDLPKTQDAIQKGRDYVESLIKKIFNIDSEISNLNIINTKEEINILNQKISEYETRETLLKENIISLKESCDETRLNELIEKKEHHKTVEYNRKLEIKQHKQIIRDEEHEIAILSGDVFKLKKEGVDYKNEINELKNSKICPTCGQELGQEHQEHIKKGIKEIELKMFVTADQINKKEKEKNPHQIIIDSTNKKNDELTELIQQSSINMENALIEIGQLTNDKNDVIKRKEIQIEIDQIPVLIQNEKLKIQLLQQKIDSYENNLKQIEENKRINEGIVKAKIRLTELEKEESEEKENIFIKKNLIGEKQTKIKENITLLKDFKKQEYRDSIMNLYKKCVHRDGIPRQMLSNYIIPKINSNLEIVLSVAPFKVWLDQNDLKPKLVYTNRPKAIIDCISASGKERTFSSVVLKFALNQINIKAKPNIFLLDEVMGKLDDESVEEFIEILQMIKINMKKVLIIEQRVNIEPDYNIDVQLDEKGISSLNIL